ncbi:MAG: hypothetical protein ACRDOM_08995 [Nocardioides sp.]
MNRHAVRAAAALGASTLVLVTMAPALAATTVAQSSASALTLGVAGNEQGSGTVTATHDGESESVHGETSPPVDVLNNQGLLNVGVLAQQATAGVTGDRGTSAACAGVAGEGGAVAQIGDSSCLVPGQPIGLSVANLDLSDLVVFDPGTEADALNQVTDPVVQQAIAPLTQEISNRLQEQLGNGGIFGGTLGAVEARCTSAAGSGASGTASIINGKISAAFGGESVDLLNFPVNPAPNTKVVTNLSRVASLFIDALERDLETTLGGELAGVGELTDAAQTQIVDAVIGEIEPQLAPLEENVLVATLNKQARPSAGAINVTAIDLQVLPAAQEQLDASLVSAEIANVTCGPNGRVVPTNEKLPEVPTVIPAGTSAETAPTDDDSVLGAMAVLLVGLVGVVGYRRLTAGS